MIVIELRGGLGNQMFQFSMGKKLSLITGQPLVLDTSFLNEKNRTDLNFVYRDYDLGIFNIKVDRVIDLKKEHEMTVIQESDDHEYTPEIFDFSRQFFKDFPGSLLTVLGYWQKNAYITDIFPTLREEFTLKEEMGEASKRLQQEILSCGKSSVCVNIRRGDFVNTPQGEKFHGWYGKDYVEQAARQAIFGTIDSPRFFVFSDDISWCEENLNKIGNVSTVIVGHEFAGERFGEYLELMKSCSNFIIPNSSFAWWAANLSTTSEDKIVVAPKVWFKVTHVDTSELCPRTWIRI